MSEQRRRTALLLWLAGFVVVFGAVAWLISAGAGSHNDPAAPNRVAPTSTPQDCPSQELEVVGAFNECATVAPDMASVCSVKSRVLEVLVRFSGSNEVFGLIIEIDGLYGGPGPYDLLPWAHELGTPGDVPKVAIDEYGSDTLWQSVAGVVTVTGSDGRSGTVNAVLQASSATIAVPGPTLSVIGPWSCP